MTTQPIEDGPGQGARVYQLRPDHAGELAEPLPTHYEVDLDDPDEAPPSRAPVFVDVVTRDAELRPIVPASLRRGNLAPTVKRAAGRTGHRVGYHAVRSPAYVVLASWWAVVGVFRLIGRQLRWWWVTEQGELRQAAATSNDPQTWLKLHHEARVVRRWRGIVLLAQLVGATGGVLALVLAAPLWAQLAALAVVVPLLARLGRPAGRPIVSPAVVTHRFRKLTSDVVLRAYYAAGLGHPDKPDQQIMFGSPMARDGEGSRVLVDLPYGRGLDDAVKAKPKIASGLDVAVSQVFIHRDRSSHRRHVLWVADRDPLAVPAGRSPLLDCKPRDIWQPAPFGLDERGRRVTLSLLWISVLIGAQPRKGKTFAARLLALYAALDPYVTLTVVDGKNSPDWKPFRAVAHRLICGTHPNPVSADPLAELVDALREIQHHIHDVNAYLSKLPASEAPEGKLTRDLARRHPQLRVWVLVMEEFQVYFETEDQNTNKEIAGLLAYIQAVGPSAGVILLSSSQKPSGVGAGDVQRLFNRFRDNHAARFALKCANRDVSNAVLGSEAYGEGIDASALPTGPEYRGVGYLYGLTDETPTVRTYLADGQDAERILLAARALRERAGTLSGLAAGEDFTRTVRDVLADVSSVFYAGEAHVSWQQIAARMTEKMPEHYADLTQEAISAQVRPLGVPSVNVKQGGQVLKGAKLADVQEAVTRRQITGGAS